MGRQRLPKKVHNLKLEVFMQLRYPAMYVFPLSSFLSNLVTSTMVDIVSLHESGAHVRNSQLKVISLGQ